MTDFNSFLATNIKLKNINDVKYIRVGYTTSDPQTVLTDTEFYIEITRQDLRIINETESLFFSTFNNGRLSKINVIQLLNNERKLLAYRKIPQIVTIIQGDNTIEIEVTINTNVSEEFSVSFSLNYLNHINADVQDQHENINDLTEPKIDLIQNHSRKDFSEYTEYVNSVSNIYDDYIAETITKGLKTPYDSTSYFENIYSSYDHRLFYYWEKSALYSFLMNLKDMYTQQKEKEFLVDLANEISDSTVIPFIGFSAEYGSFLYWYKFTDDYIAIIIAGSNIYNHIDVYFLDNTKRLSYKAKYFDDSNNRFRLKINNYFSTLYFVLDEKLYAIEPKLSKDIYLTKEKIQITNNTSLSFTVRSPQKDDVLLVQEKTCRKSPDGENHVFSSVYNTEFSDLNHLLLGYDSDNKKYYIFNAIDSQSLCYESNSTTYSQILPYPTNEEIANNALFDGLYVTSANQMQYLLSISYKPIFANTSYTIGYSSVYDNYLILFKFPYKHESSETLYSRRIVSRDYFTNTEWINNEYIGFKSSDEKYYMKSLLTDSSSSFAYHPIMSERCVYLVETSLPQNKFVFARHNEILL